MPRQNVDYSKTVIYKIVCNDENIDYLYIGSTTDFTKRKNNHKSNCFNDTKKEYTQKKYIEMRNNGGWENFRMIEVEKFPCNDKREAEKREEEVRLELKANMNIRRCYLSEEERKQQKADYREINKEILKKQEKDYRENNKIKIKESMKVYKENNREKIRQNIKDYRENNKEKMLEKERVYRENNREKIKESRDKFNLKNKDRLNNYGKQYR